MQIQRDDDTFMRSSWACSLAEISVDFQVAGVGDEIARSEILPTNDAGASEAWIQNGEGGPNMTCMAPDEYPESELDPSSVLEGARQKTPLGW